MMLKCKTILSSAFMAWLEVRTNLSIALFEAMVWCRKIVLDSIGIHKVSKFMGSELWTIIWYQLIWQANNASKDNNCILHGGWLPWENLQPLRMHDNNEKEHLASKWLQRDTGTGNSNPRQWMTISILHKTWSKHYCACTENTLQPLHHAWNVE